MAGLSQMLDGTFDFGHRKDDLATRDGTIGEVGRE
jgi:hypothetical protein